MTLKSSQEDFPVKVYCSFCYEDKLYLQDQKKAFFSLQAEWPFSQEKWRAFNTFLTYSFIHFPSNGSVPFCQSAYITKDWEYGLEDYTSFMPNKLDWEQETELTSLFRTKQYKDFETVKNSSFWLFESSKRVTKQQSNTKYLK